MEVFEFECPNYKGIIKLRFVYQQKGRVEVQVLDDVAGNWGRCVEADQHWLIAPGIRALMAENQRLRAVKEEQGKEMV